MTRTEFDYIRRLVQERSAVVLDDGKEYLVDARLTPLLRRHQLQSWGELVSRLQGPECNGLAKQVVEAMVTTETSFFRDTHPFETLQKNVLPLLRERRGAERSLTIWSAACASGQEPYSIALLLREHFSELGSWKVRLIASDLSGEMLDRARQGVFNQIEVNRGLPAPLLVKYFTKRGMDWIIADEIRRMVEFREINLDANWPELPPVDVIFLRNILIYFSVPTKKTILAKMRRVLRPDGYLVLGGAETTFHLDDSFRRVVFGKSGFYQLVDGATTGSFGPSVTRKE